ncbi:sensor histidine kinase [Actinacidiphila glaucinigra]|uniref:sensor histidine kinase n=1 Tax=Actinacidiphila glaucinigra TaxID=235986 RepID=UPI002E35074C|nr:histidine kinase [Actinacidiphila glaucinigra]
MTTAAARRPHRDDVLIAVAGLAGGLTMWAFGLYTYSGNHPAGDRAWLPLLPLVVMAGCELLRRTAPRVAIVVAVLTLCADFVIGSLLVTVLMFTDLVYAAVLYGPKRLTRVVPVGSVLGTAALTATAVAVHPVAESLLIGVVGALVSVAPASTGVIVRRHRDEAAHERLRAEQTALLAELDRREAVGRERARMARELHDMVAGHLSAIAVHSTAALSLDRHEGPAREALAVIRENSVAGLSEMRRLIGLLRDSAGEDGEPAPVPRLAGLDTLVEQMRAAAPHSAFVLRDERPEGAVPLPAPVELAAYRIVQESLTNVLKHASPGEVPVMLEQDGRALTVTVASPCRSGGTAHRSGPRAPGSGSGLIGMRERTELLGGTFEAGSEGTTWRVRAVLPMEGNA